MKDATAAVQVAGTLSDRTRTLGLGALGAIVAFVAIWLYVAGKPALQTRAATAPNGVSSSRFAANPWQLPNDDLLGFVAIPAGGFIMGSDPAFDGAAYENERWSSERKQGAVELPQFYIGRYEVTVAQFAAFAADTQHAVSSQMSREHGDHPVTSVTWTDALAYARWLEVQLVRSAQTPAALKALLDEGWRITLPSEAQWEKAARGGDGRLFPWGNVADASQANYGRSGTVAVGTFACAECAFGLADMSGNVWELTRSPFQPYPWTPADAPHDARADALFVMRGGGFSDAANNVRAAVRGGIDPGARRPFIGFRLVIER